MAGSLSPPPRNQPQLRRRLQQAEDEGARGGSLASGGGGECDHIMSEEEASPSWRRLLETTSGEDQEAAAATQQSPADGGSAEKTCPPRCWNPSSQQQGHGPSLVPKGPPGMSDRDRDRSGGGGGGSRRGYDIQGIFRTGAMIAWAIYVGLLCVVKRYAPASSYEIPDGPERAAHLSSLVLLLVANGGRILPLLLRPGVGASSTKLLRSGVVVGTFTVQAIAVSGNALLALVPTPVIVDPVTGLRTHLVRWVEWTALAFLLTFFTTNLGVAPATTTTTTTTTRPVEQNPRKLNSSGGSSNGQVTYGCATCLALSTLCGLVFPFCPTRRLWMATMAASCVLFVPLYGHLYRTVRRYQSCVGAKSGGGVRQRSDCQPALKGCGGGFGGDVRGGGFRGWDVECDVDDAAVLRTSVVLGGACAATWTGLVLFYIAACCIRIVRFRPHSALGGPSLVSVGLCFFEVASKVWYLSVLVDAYEQVFDETGRVKRRLERLRDVMGAIWETSGDVIVYCERSEDGGGVVHSIVSPAFLRLVGIPLHGGDPSLTLTADAASGEFTAHAVDLSKPRAVYSTQSLDHKEMPLHNHHDMTTGDFHPAAEKAVLDRNLRVLADLSLRAFDPEMSASQRPTTELAKLASDGTHMVSIDCEVKRSGAMDDGSSYVLVLRDVSDRLRRFESEKRLLRQVTERRKDAETTQFARHETKNGILAAMALLDQIKESLALRSTSDLDHDNHSGEMECATTGQAQQRPQEPDLNRDLTELECTLRDVLDTALEQAMVREVVYGHYIARMERVQVPEVLESIYLGPSTKYPLRTLGGQIPDLALDRQLIRYIYRNAVTNACKYGKPNGTVETVLSYHPETRVFAMEVVNEAGSNQNELVMLGGLFASSSLESPRPAFMPLASCQSNRPVSEPESSGDAVCVMQKCAEAHGGSCSIRFEPKRTTFRFACPATLFPPPPTRSCSMRIRDSSRDAFRLPAGTWGIAVDDSNVQRKLMDRFLKRAGIQEGRRIILGETADQVLSMDSKVADLMARHPNDKFLLIVDENLDMAVRGALHRTVSGSQCVGRLRDRLDPATERRLLALIRSANDSLPDVLLYKSRAHGYLHKEPMQKDVLEVIRPWWMERFSEEGYDIPNEGPSCHVDTSDTDDDPCYEPSRDEIFESVEAINELAQQERSSGGDRWGEIREKLLLLKGDVKTLESRKAEAISALVGQLDDLLDPPSLPEAFSEQWANARSLLDACI